MRSRDKSRWMWFQRYLILLPASMAVIASISFVASVAFANPKTPDAFMTGNEYQVINGPICEITPPQEVAPYMRPSVPESSGSSPTTVAGIDCIVCIFVCAFDPTTAACIACLTACAATPI